MSEDVKKPKTLKELISEEYKRCSVDPSYFMKKYCIIQHPKKGKVNFELFSFQEQCIQDFEEHRYVIVNKGRQLGLSTVTAGYILYKMIFNSDFNVLVIATKQEVAKNLVTKVRVMHENLPSWMKGTTIEDNKLSLRFKNGSQVKAVAASIDAGRSEALSLLVLDEAAHIENIDGIWAAAQSTLSTGGSAILISSPNGVGNLFHKKWVEAGQGKEFFAIRLPWYVHPERDQTWRDSQDDLLGVKMAAQENDCDFLTSGNAVLEGTLIQWYRETHQQPPLETRGFDGNYWIWEYPSYQKSYIVCADVARGDGQDESAFVVLDVESVKQVAEYKGAVSTKDFGNMLVAVASEWNNALLVIDNNGIGWNTVQVALDREYPNLFYHYKNDTYVDSAKHLIGGYDIKDKSNMVPGVSINHKTRPVMISKLETYFRERTPICRSKRSLDEFDTFLWVNGRAEAQRGYHDDLTMSWAMAFWVRDTALRLRQQGIDMQRATLDNFKKSFYSTSKRNSTSWTQELPNKEKDSLNWLL